MNLELRQNPLADEVMFRHSMQRNILHDFVVGLTDPVALTQRIRAHGVEGLCTQAEQVLAQVACHEAQGRTR